MSERSHGQVGYEAYAAVTDWKNYQGLPMPQWAELPERIREAWEVAASAVAVRAIEEMDVEVAVDVEALKGAISVNVPFVEKQPALVLKRR